MLALLCVANSWWQRCSWNLEVVVIERVADLAGTLVKNIYIYQMNTRQQVRMTKNIDQQAKKDTPISMTSSSDTDVLTLLTQQLLRMQEDADENDEGETRKKTEIGNRPLKEMNDFVERPRIGSSESVNRLWKTRKRDTRGSWSCSRNWRSDVEQMLRETGRKGK